MLKKDIIDVLHNFEKETWSFNENEQLNNDMQYIYNIENEIRSVSDDDIEKVYNKLISLIEMIRFKYGFESIIIGNNSELESLKKIIEDVKLDDNDIIDQSNSISKMYKDYMSNITDLDFIQNNFENKYGYEGLYLELESLKSLVKNKEYRNMLGNISLEEVALDCIKLNEGKGKISIEKKYSEIIKQIWKYSLSNKVENGNDFKILFSNISGPLLEQADNLINRPEQNSCSMISSNFIATYGSPRRIGLIYPSDSNIIMASAYDLSSNVFGKDAKNKEKGTTIATPEVLEKIGIERAKTKGEDLYSSSCYSEILIDSNTKPCGILMIGLNDEELKVNYEEVKKLSEHMNLPLYSIDVMKYKSKLANEEIANVMIEAMVNGQLDTNGQPIFENFQEKNDSWQRGYTMVGILGLLSVVISIGIIIFGIMILS